MANTTQLEVRAPPLPKIKVGYVPLSLLVKRLVQFSFNELEMLLESISSSGASSEEKKSRIMQYVVYTRKQFIKALVLAIYAADAATVSEVVDLKAWLDSQYRLYDEAVDVLCEIRKVTGRAKYVPAAVYVRLCVRADARWLGSQILTWGPRSRCFRRESRSSRFL